MTICLLMISSDDQPVIRTTPSPTVNKVIQSVASRQAEHHHRQQMVMNSRRPPHRLSAVNFIPFIGPARYSVEAAVAYFDDDQKRARDKGLLAVVYSVIDLMALIAFLAVAAQIIFFCESSPALRLARPIFDLCLVISLAAVLVGAKIVAEQVSRSLIEKVINVNQASSAMVNSVALTATGIEAVVSSVSRTSNATAETFIIGYEIVSKVTGFFFAVPLFVVETTKTVVAKLKRLIKQLVETMLFLAMDLVTGVLVWAANLVQSTIERLANLVNHFLVPVLGDSFWCQLPKFVVKVIEFTQLVMANGLNLVQNYPATRKIL